jgi:hypothetical protein
LGGYLFWQYQSSYPVLGYLYYISNKHTKTVAEPWDGTNLRCDLRRTLYEKIMVQWHELEVVANTFSFVDEEG